MPLFSMTISESSGSPDITLTAWYNYEVDSETMWYHFMYHLKDPSGYAILDFHRVPEEEIDR